jgi:uncharacterized Zn-binding protein involved in type VI secretion
LAGSRVENLDPDMMNLVRIGDGTDHGGTVIAQHADAT